MQVKAPAQAFNYADTMLDLAPVANPMHPLPQVSGPVTPAPAASCFLPKEHGSWSLVLEPLALGLLVVPSPAGLALATAAFAGFLIRRPLRAVFNPVSSLPPAAARQTVVLLSTLAIAALLEVVALGDVTSLWPLLLAAPLGGLFIYFDAQGDSRAAAAELAGSSAFALLPAALATLAGWSIPHALALAALSLARNAPTVLAVRGYLRKRKGQPVRPAVPMVAAALALGAVALLCRLHLVPPLAAGGALLLLLRSICFCTPWSPVWPARRIGIGEAVLGVIYITLIAIAYRAQWPA
jgi:hypothetical protein